MAAGPQAPAAQRNMATGQPDALYCCRPLASSIGRSLQLPLDSSISRSLQLFIRTLDFSISRTVLLLDFGTRAGFRVLTASVVLRDEARGGPARTLAAGHAVRAVLALPALALHLDVILLLPGLPVVLVPVPIAVLRVQ
eukprot:500230-Pyramimonas_sp.AAC.1